MQYFLTYVLGWQSDGSKRADMGTMAHKVMEILAGLKKRFQQDNVKNILRLKMISVEKLELIKIAFTQMSL